MTDEQQPEIKLPPEMGKPLVTMARQSGTQAEIQYGLSSQLLGHLLSDATPDEGFGAIRAEGLQNKAMYADIAARAIERLGDDKAAHQLVQEYIASDDLRQQIVRDVLNTMVAFDIEFARIKADPDDPLLKLTGLAPFDDLHTDEDRQRAIEIANASFVGELATLEAAYIDFVVGVVTGKISPANARFGAPPIRQQALIPAFTPDAISFINARPALAAIRAIWAGGEGWQRPEDGQPFFTDKSGTTVYMQEGAQFNPLAVDAAWQRVLSLDDSKVSTFLICLGKWMADTGGEQGLTKVRVHVADILSFRGLKKEPHGGYKRAQKEEARRDVLALSSIWVRSIEQIRLGAKH